MLGGESKREQHLAHGEAVSSAQLEQECWGKTVQEGAESQVEPVVCVVGVIRNIEEFGLDAEGNERFLKDVKQRSDMVPALRFAPSGLTPRPAHPALCFYPPAE